jgi:hypothetical protein
MIYEARHARRFNIVLAILCLLLSLLGFAVAGVIPTQSGSYPMLGWAIVLACFAAAFIFVRRALDRQPLVRIDSAGLYARNVAPQPLPWDQIAGVQTMRAGVQQIVRFVLRDPSALTGAGPLKRAVGAADRAMSFGHFGINPTYYDRGVADLLAAIRHYRPDLAV